MCASASCDRLWDYFAFCAGVSGWSIWFVGVGDLVLLGLHCFLRLAHALYCVIRGDAWLVLLSLCNTMGTASLCKHACINPTIRPSEENRKIENQMSRQTRAAIGHSEGHSHGKLTGPHSQNVSFAMHRISCKRVKGRSHGMDERFSTPSSKPMQPAGLHYFPNTCSRSRKTARLHFSFHT